MSIDLEAAWGLVHEPNKLDSLYERSDDPDVKEIRQRIMSSEGESVRVLLEEGGELGGPFAVSRVFTDRRRWDTAGLRSGVDFGRPIQPYLDDVELHWQIAVLACSPHESDRTWAIDHYEDAPDTRSAFAVHLVNAGDARGERRLLEALDASATHLEGRVDRIFGRAPRDHDESDLPGMLIALINHPIAGAAPILARLLRSDYAELTLIALGQHDDPSVVDAVEAYRNSIVGDKDVSAVLRAGAANVLRRHGQTIPLDDARFLQRQSPRRYGYPKWEHFALTHRIAAEAFLAQGNDDDKAWVASLATSPFSMLRAVAKRIGERALAYWDTARVNRYLDEQHMEPIFEALESPNTVFVDKIVERLQEITDDDDALRRRLTEWCRRAFERVPNIYVPDDECMPPDLNYAMYFLGNLGDEDRTLLEGTSSAWIQTFVLDGGDMERDEEEVAVPEDVSVELFDAAPWAIGKNVNGLAVSPDGTRIAVVGENCSRQVDASTGMTAFHQELRWSWGYDVAYSPDGTMLAACFHGGHVEIYDASSGERLAHLEGHGGVPNGVRCLAWSADGSMLVTGGSDAYLIAWDVAAKKSKWEHSGGPGSYQDVVFLPDGRVLASHVSTSKGEKNFLEILDVETGKVKEKVARKKSIWAIAIREDGLIALGGEDKKINLSKDPLKKKFKTWRNLDQAQVTRLEFVGNTLYATGQDGFLMAWDTETLEDTSYIGEGSSIWALATHGDRVFAAGKAGQLHVIDDGALRQVEGASHSRRVVAIDEVEGGIVTADWDGKIILWSSEGGIGREVVNLKLTIESSAKVDDDTILYGTRKGLYLVRVSDGTVLASTEVRADEVAIDGDVVGAYARSDLALYALPSLEPKGDPINVGTDTMNAVAAAPGGGFVTGNEDGQTCFVKDGARVWEKKDHGADRLELGDPHCNVSSIVFTRDGSRFASAATDHITRVYSWPDAELQLRIACGFGLFNRIDFSPDGKLLAIPASWRLQVFDVETGEETCTLSAVKSFDGNELAGAKFIGERELLVGCDTGRIFRVQL